MRRWEQAALGLGAVQGMLMAGYHFTLPIQFGWANYLPEDAPTVGWALFALNNYFSFNLLMLSAGLAYLVFLKKEAVFPIVLLATLLTLFWTFSIVYQVLRPMPLPIHLAWLGMLLPGLAVANALLVGVPGWSLARRWRTETW